MKRKAFMKTDSKTLWALPEDKSPDCGAETSGGVRALLFGLMLLLTAFFAAGLALQAGWKAAAIVLWLALMAPAVWLGRQLWLARKAVPTLPRSHDVLIGLLGFDVTSVSRGVAATAFFYPDRVAPGETPQLLVFLENHMSRRRLAKVVLGPHADLGLGQTLELAVPMMAGQAVVCTVPLPPVTALVAGAHDLPLRLSVEVPEARGQTLPGAPAHLHDLWTLRLAVPFTVDPSVVPPVEQAGAAEISCHTLASVVEPGARLAMLHTLAAPGWMRLRAPTPGMSVKAV